MDIFLLTSPCSKGLNPPRVGGRGLSELSGQDEHMEHNDEETGNQTAKSQVERAHLLMSFEGLRRGLPGVGERND